VDCTIDRHLLEGYIDGELNFERTLEVEAHLPSCSGCNSEVRNWKEVRGAMQGSNLYHRAPTKLEEKIRGLVPRENRSEPFSWFARWVWAGGGAAFATAALLLVFFMVGRPAGTSEDQEIVSSHVRSLMADHLMDVISTDQHTVKPWFDGKLDFAPPVEDLKEQGYPLAGGRLDYLENHTVAVLVYHRALHDINLYIWPAEDKNVSPIHEQTLQGYNVLCWKKSGFEFRAVSDLNVAELSDFARLETP
jgi:anti-sigma factor RsiW